MSLKQHYYGLTKTASSLALGTGLGLGLGALYGLGEEDRNYHSELMHRNVLDRGLQGAGAGGAGIAAHKLVKGLGGGPVYSGITGIAAGLLASQLLQPKTETYNPNVLWR